MRHFFFSILIAALLLASCSKNPTVLTPAGKPAAATSARLQASPTPSMLPPAPTSNNPPATPTPTPELAGYLRHNRPLIAYEGGSSESKRLILVDPSSATSFEFNFPPGAVFAVPFLDGLSPGARYFVYYEGGRIDEYGQLQATPPDFVMHIFDLMERKVLFSAPLLSPEFPEDLKPIVEMTEDQYWMVEPDRQAKLQNMYDTMQRTVLNHLRTVAWSPDGNLLAFASQNPGPLSDMNFFDPVSGEARRLASKSGHVLDLTWNPDSSAIALETTLYDRHMRQVTTDLLDRAGDTLGSVENTYFQGWLGPTRILLHKEIDFRDPGFNLAVMSLIDNSLTMLWEGSFDNFAASPDLSSVLISSSEPNEPGQSPGLYLKTRDAETPFHLSEAAFWKVAYWGSGQFAFAASAPNTGIFEVPQKGGTFGISQTGELNQIDDGNWYLLVSPDKKFLAAYGPFDTIKGLRVFGEDGKLLASLSDSKITCLQWSPASTSLAYQVGDRLYLWEEGNASARQMAIQLEDDLPRGECGFAWINETP